MVLLIRSLPPGEVSGFFISFLFIDNASERSDKNTIGKEADDHKLVQDSCIYDWPVKYGKRV
jgi:hypothetical protein